MVILIMRNKECKVFPIRKIIKGITKYFCACECGTELRGFGVVAFIKGHQNTYHKKRKERGKYGRK